MYSDQKSAIRLTMSLRSRTAVSTSRLEGDCDIVKILSSKCSSIT